VLFEAITARLPLLAPEVGLEAKASTDLLDELMEPAATVAKLVGPQPVVLVPAGDLT
jgi:hypothetical protein